MSTKNSTNTSHCLSSRVPWHSDPHPNLLPSLPPFSSGNLPPDTSKPPPSSSKYPATRPVHAHPTTLPCPPTAGVPLGFIYAWPKDPSLRHISTFLIPSHPLVLISLWRNSNRTRSLPTKRSPHLHICIGGYKPRRPYCHQTLINILTQPLPEPISYVRNLQLGHSPSP
jgi:hypothetical protein